MSTHTKAERKALGAYYTPDNLSQLLTDWAIRLPTEKVLEPSFGGCGFLEASVNTLETLGCEQPNEQLYGADIDKKAFDFLSDKLGVISNIKDHFVCKDFIKTTIADFDNAQFDVVIGNPPYVSMHNMSEGQRKSCRDVLKNSIYSPRSIGTNASLWAFFLLHTLSFLKNGARLAWVLPSSLLHANYSEAVMTIYRKHFESLKVIKLNQRFFQALGVDEISVILLAEGYSDKPIRDTNIQYHVAENLEALKKKMEKESELEAKYSGNYKYSLLPPTTVSYMHQLASCESTLNLGEFSKVIIGMVTGDNNTFVLSEDEVNKLDLDGTVLRPVIGRFSQLKGLIHNHSRHAKIVAGGEKCLLVCPENLHLKPSSIRDYLATVDKVKRKTNRTFAKRVNWYYPDDERYPDAFLSYMLDKGPRLVISSGKVNCTNSIHRVFFTNRMNYAQKKAVAASLLSSYSQLSSELVGRSYGSGVLKLEPTAAKNVSIFTSERVLEGLSNETSKIDSLLVRGNLAEAQKVVDKVICEVEDIPLSVFNELRKCAEKLRQDRYQGLSRNS